MKKFLAGVLVFAMMLSMCAFVSADGETAAPTEVIIANNTFNALTAGATVNSPLAADSSKVGGINLRATTFGSNGIVKADVLTKAEGDNYVKTGSSFLGYNVNKTADVFNDWGFGGDYPVFSFKYDMMIPDTDAYKTHKRVALVPMGSKTATGKSSYNIYPSIENGKIFATIPTDIEDDITVLYSDELDYTYGDWATFEVRSWIDTDGKMIVYVIANDKIFYAYKTKSDVVGMATEQINFMYYNAADGKSQVKDTTKPTETTPNPWVNGIHSTKPTVVSETCYNDVSIKLLTATAKFSSTTIDELLEAKRKEEEEKIAAEKEATPYAELINYKCDALGSGTAVFVNSGAIGRDTVKGSATDGTPTHTIVDGSYLSIGSTAYAYYVGNIRDSFRDYVKKTNGETTTFVYSYDMSVSNFNANINNSFAFGVDLSNNDTTDRDGNKVTARKVNDVSVNFSIDTNGVAKFVGNIIGYGVRVANTERTETRTITPNRMFNVKLISEITHGETNYGIKFYGVLENQVIYEENFTLTYVDYDNDGISDDIHVGMITLGIGTDTKPHDATVTCYDNMLFAKNENFDWSTVDTDAWINRTVKLEKDASGNIDVVAKKSGDEVFTSGTLLIATYDAKGKLVKLFSKGTIEDGKFVYKLPASELSGIKTVKGFVFESIATAKALMPSGALILE